MQMVDRTCINMRAQELIYMYMIRSVPEMVLREGTHSRPLSPELARLMVEAVTKQKWP